MLVADTEDELVDLGQAHAVEHGHTPPPTREQVLTRALGAAGITVFEVNRPDRANRRRKGKSDPVDAEAAARAVLAGQATAIPKNRDGAVESLRALTIARNSAVKATTTASNQIKAILVGADQELRDAMKVQSLLELATRVSNLAPLDGQHLAWPASGAAGSSCTPRSSSST